MKQRGEITSKLIDQYVDEIVTVDETATARAVISFLETERTVVEGAGAVGLSALYENQIDEKYKRAVVFVSGSNIDINVISRLIEREMATRGQLVRINLSIPDRPGALKETSEILADKGANIVQVFHDRKFAERPGDVDVTLVMETRNADHKREILEHLVGLGLDLREL